MHIKYILFIAVFFITSYSHAKKPVVGIANIQAVSQNISCEGWNSRRARNCNRALEEGFRTMLETAIVKSKKMDVMERARLDMVLGEQALGESGLTTSGGQVGGLIGVDYMIYGSITKFGVRPEGFSVGKGVTSRVSNAIGDVSTSSLTTEMAVDVKITNVANGKIVLSDTVEGEAKQGQEFRVGGVQIAKGSGDPFADVQRVVAAKLAEAVVTTRIPYKVIKVQGDGTLILNYGNVFLQPGDKLILFEVGNKFVDPDTGEVLGAEETQVGLVEVVAAEAKFSKAVVVSSEKPVTAGSVLRRAKRSAGKPAKRKRSGGIF